jgi:hypothetical protein
MSDTKSDLEKGIPSETIEDISTGTRETRGEPLHVKGNVQLLDGRGHIRLVPTPTYVHASHTRTLGVT